MTMLIKLLVILVLWSGMTTIVIAQPININTPAISLGVVNGDIINNKYLNITKVLSNPILLSIKQQELNVSLHSLIINNAVLKKNQNGNVVITVVKQVKGGGNINVQTALSLYIDGRQVNVSGQQAGTAVRLVIPSKFDLLEVKAVKPLSIQLPKLYRGPFNFMLDIEGWSE